MYSISKLSAALALVLGVASCYGASGKDDGEGVGATGGSAAGKGGAGGAASEDFVVTELRQTKIERVDLLLMVDNSIGMADKQELLAEALPVLVDRLTRPLCITESGDAAARQGEDCPQGSLPEVRAITDIHIGIVTSSLGGHGGDQCSTSAKNDRAQLLASVRSGLPAWNDAGFLAWDPGATHSPPGEVDLASFVDDARHHIVSAGESGCGYEASLEAWYRFLIDAEPVTDMTVGDNYSVRGLTNETVLAQRDRFLRSDSAVMIVMLSDENDCSILDEDGSLGWVVGFTGTNQSPFRMPRASGACAGDPNDFCCRVCTALPEAGCPDNPSDSECSKGEYLSSTLEDHPNLRCFKQVQRFGVDLLYPTSRYVEGLTSKVLRSRQGFDVPNPLFAARDGRPARDPDAVMLVGIVGVPWQDVADEASLQGSSLSLLSADELVALDRWSVMLGSSGGPATDPHMLEQVEPRTAGAPHPLVFGGDYAIASAEATGRPNAINGHEQNIVGRDDLQYACTFPLRQPIPCDPPAVMGNDVGCDCNASEAAYNRSICSYPGGSEAEGVQEYAKAYPSVRQLEVLRDVASKAVVGSICPKNTQPNGEPHTDPFYGYNPVVSAMIEKLKGMEKRGCLARPLPINDDGSIECRVVALSVASECTCDAPGERAPDEELTTVARSHVLSDPSCSLGVQCEPLCVCEIEQLRGEERDACVAGTEFDAGFCYVDAGPLPLQCSDDGGQVIRLPSAGLGEGKLPLMICPAFEP